jgi:hypothetical protein
MKLEIMQCALLSLPAYHATSPQPAPKQNARQTARRYLYETFIYEVTEDSADSNYLL